MSTVHVSLHGRDVGLDKDRNLTARIGAKFPSIAIGVSGSELDIHAVAEASTASNVSAAGTTTFGSSLAKSFTLDAPVKGLLKTLVATGVSTGSSITPASGTIESTLGSSGSNILFTSKGQSLRLQALSTALWQVVGNVGAVTLT